jgi:hypothetical protein
MMHNLLRMYACIGVIAFLPVSGLGVARAALSTCKAKALGRDLAAAARDLDCGLADSGGAQIPAQRHGDHPPLQCGARRRGARNAGAGPRQFSYLAPLNVVVSTTIYLTIAAIVYALIGRFSKRPIRVFRIVAIVAPYPGI